MKFIILLLIFSLLSFLNATNAPIEIQSIRFDKVKVGKYDWTQIEVKLFANASFSSKTLVQRNSKYLDDIEMCLYLCYDNRNQKTKDFYKSTVKIVSIEKGVANYAYFYIPGIVVERDRLDKTPFAWMADFTISGNKIPNDPKKFKNNFSSRLNSLSLVESFLSNLEEGIQKNEGILLPIYLAPNGVRGKASNLNKLVLYHRLDPVME